MEGGIEDEDENDDEDEILAPPALNHSPIHASKDLPLCNAFPVS